MILIRDGYLCKPCQHNGLLTKAVEVDHITPKAQGGTDSKDNLQAICNNCHTEKTNLEKNNGKHT